MDRGAWWATVHGVAESDLIRVTEHVGLCNQRYISDKCRCRRKWTTATEVAGSGCDMPLQGGVQPRPLNV